VSRRGEHPRQAQWRMGRDFARGRQLCGVGVDRKQVIRFQLGIVGQDLLLGYPLRQPFQNLLNGDPMTANPRFPEPHVRINRDPLKERIVGCGHLCLLPISCIQVLT
jgi:hypothetical protein